MPLLLRPASSLPSGADIQATTRAVAQARTQPAPHLLLGAVALAACALLGAGTAHAAPAATVLFAQGDVAQQSSDRKQALKKGDSIESGATLLVGAGKLHIRFVDGALMSFMPNTRFLVKDYAAPTAGQAGSGKADMNLLEGGLRTITGAVSKFNKESYKLETPTGTVGVRGTEFVATVESVNTTVGTTTFARTGEAASRDVPAGRTVDTQNEQSQISVNRPAQDEPVASRRSGISTARVNTVAPLGSGVDTETTNATTTPVKPTKYPLTTQTPSDNAQLVGESSDVQQNPHFTDGTVTQTYNDADAPPVLNQVSVSFAGSTVTSASYTGNGSTLAGADGQALQWGYWLSASKSADSAAGAPAFGSSVSPTVYWLTGTALKDMPTTGTLSYTSIGQAGSMSLGGQAATAVTQVNSTFNLNVGTGRASMDMALQGGGATASFKGVPLVYDSGANTLRATSTMGVLTVNGVNAGDTPQLQGSGKLYGSGASHAGMSYQIKPGANDANPLQAWGVVGYKKN